MAQYQLLQEYVVCLQRQNQAKNTQRQTLYNQIERLQADITALQSQLNLAKKRAESSQEKELSLKIRDLEEEISILKYEQQHLFEENLSIINALEESELKVHDCMRENKLLRCQKEELERFRISLQRISRSLQELEKQRCTLADTNIMLIQQNSYLKAILENGQNRNFSQPSVRKSSSLMMNSFEKISEYDEYEEQSHEDSMSKSIKSKQMRSAKSVRQIPVDDSYKCQQFNSNDEPKQNETMNNSSYLMIDDNSTSNMNISCENNDPKGEIADQTGSQNEKQNSFLRRKQNKDSPTSREDFSCDVIQEVCDNLSHDTKRSISENESMRKIDRSHIESIQVQKLHLENIQIKKRLQSSQMKCKRLQESSKYLESKLIEMEKSEQYNIAQMQERIEELLRNYDIIERESRRKDEELEKMSFYIQNLQRENEKQSVMIKKYESLKDNRDKRRCKRKAESQNYDLEQDKENNLSSEREQRGDLENMDRMMLIRQNNMLIEKVNEVEREKNHFYRQIIQSHYSQSETERIFNQADKENKMTLNLGNISTDYNEKRACSNYVDKQPRRSFSILCEQDVNRSKQPSQIQTKFGLKQRIQMIKGQNQRLIKELSIN